jgi:glycosyltransferase involved in cell wall biosynthesis
MNDNAIDSAQPLAGKAAALLFTVFTPTFNRAHTLHRPYQSLRAQTSRNFEWLVVDDGSVDGTRELVEAWQREADFPIRYVAQANGGKHVAFNTGVREARGTLFLTLDSDDECVPTALERFAEHWRGIPESDRARFSAVTCLCVDQYGQLVGDRFPREILDSNSLELRYRYRVKGEKWGFQRTEVLRAFPFPEPSGVRYVHPSVVWNAISSIYVTRYVNEALRVYHVSTTPGESLTTETNERKHAVGQAMSYRSLLNNGLKWLRYAPREFAMAAVLFTYYSLLSGTGLTAQFRALRSAARLLWLAVLPASLYKFARDRVAGRSALK